MQVVRRQQQQRRRNAATTKGPAWALTCSAMVRHWRRQRYVIAAMVAAVVAALRCPLCSPRVMSCGCLRACRQGPAGHRAPLLSAHAGQRPALLHMPTAPLLRRVSTWQVVKSARNRVAAAVAAALKPWGAASGGNGKKKGKGSKLSAAPKVEVQQPKALLQQHCQRSGWAAPRFERLAHGGMRLAGGGYRYSVAVDASAGAGAGAKGPKRRGAAAAAAAVAAGPRSYSLREADDGWERIEDAQNAAATRALYELAAGGDAALAEAAPPVWAQLPPSFQEVWLTWQEEGEVGCGGGGGEEESEEQAAARRAFVQQLLVAQADVALQQQQQQQQQAAEEEGSGGTRSWHQQQLNIMAAAVGSEEQQQQRESARLAAEQAAWRESQEGRRWAADRAK